MTFRGEERGSLVALPWLKSLAQRHPPATHMHKCVGLDVLPPTIPPCRRRYGLLCNVRTFALAHVARTKSPRYTVGTKGLKYSQVSLQQSCLASGSLAGEGTAVGALRRNPGFLRPGQLLANHDILRGNEKKERKKKKNLVFDQIRSSRIQAAKEQKKYETPSREVGEQISEESIEFFTKIAFA
ncbi:uncharacterized protein TRIVIDRAFT_65303 [Trichoderma virens Gv29-8]|uniref:Uncharacterized protein n=1 Tax=Hypocrea virens (strain Gv29-8 / FGSC 10586) TaxID=413071 RepID=G9NAK2_HYPVG|nr:uncharacterized protein TRIVIDRAFT_65303 [Trichoderma virens Gv29-8]EHK15863.1 hypothetical protein TRIVIDRAFT_65303 [Trichoderma virens Gv29-8]